jgi:uncharacterized SAM-binding protein YcdF (DUF218 family)
MFFIFSKLLLFLINPLIWILTCIFLIIVQKKQTWKRIFAYTALILIIVFCNNYLFTIIGSKWEMTSMPANSIRSHYKYAVVLGGMGSENKKTGKFYVGQSIDRVLQAIILYKQGKVDKILITGGSGAIFGQEIKEAPVVKKFCIDLGILEDDIIIEPNSKNTHENATFTKDLIGTKDKIILLTSAIHMRRSIGCFKKEGFYLDYLSTDPLSQPIFYIEDVLLPKAEALYCWTAFIKEVLGTIVYKIVGYI